MSFKLTIEINCFAVTAVKGRAHALPHRERKDVQKAEMISGLGSPIDQGFTPRACYIGKALPEQYQKLIQNRGTQNNRKSENLNSNSFLRNQLYSKSRGWELNPHIAALQAAA